MKDIITQKRLKELTLYKPDNGDFFIKIDSSIKRYSLDGYTTIYIDGRVYFIHRLAWLYVYGYFPEHQIDHINRDKKDNRLCNLREVSHSCNIRNSKLPKTNKSGVKGVSWSKTSKAWVTQIYHNKKAHNLGFNNEFSEAVCLRLAAEQCLGWDECDSNTSAYRYVKEMLATKQNNC